MVNTVLGTLALVVWSGAYALYFARDIARWWQGRHRRRMQRAAERAEAVRAYTTWMRNYPPPVPSRRPILPVAAPVVAPPRRSGEVVPFPRRLSRRR